MAHSRQQRLLYMLTQLALGHQRTDQHLANELEISLSLVHQDIKVLQDLGFNIRVMADNFYQLDQAADSSLLQIAQEEAKFLAEFCQSNATQAESSEVDIIHLLNKFEMLMHIQSESTTAKGDSSSALPPDASDNDNYLSIAQRGLKNKKLIHLQYRTGYSHEFTERNIELLSIYHDGVHWVYIVWCHLREDFREFRSDRIISMKYLDESFPPRPFDLMKYFYSILSP